MGESKFALSYMDKRKNMFPQTGLNQVEVQISKKRIQFRNGQDSEETGPRAAC